MALPSCFTNTQTMIKNVFQKIILLFILLPLTAYPWDNTGHRIIAAIAYAELTPDTKKTIDGLTAILDPGYAGQARFLYISTLADKWRKTGENNGKIPHYMNTPWSMDGTPTDPEPQANLVSVLQEKLSAYKNPHTPEKERAIALAYLVHLVGDAHQPLHCINRFSAAFPHGDRGGTLVPINTPQAKVNNLHAYWDQAAKLMLASKRYPFSNKQVLRLAKELPLQYPSRTLQNTSFHDWTTQCFTLAQQVAYQLPPNKQQVRTTAARQMVLAGGRLAGLLNTP
jgi:hypothetical protein